MIHPKPLLLSSTPTPRFSDLLEKISVKDRQNLQKHLDAIASEGHASTWQNLILSLIRLAPHSLQTVGRNAIKFFVADGPYRLQVYALEDAGNGEFQVYLPDVIDEAIRLNILSPGTGADEYKFPKQAQFSLTIERLLGDFAADLPAHYKYMLGLNRKAIRITIRAAGKPDELGAVRSLCELACNASAPVA